MRRTPAKWKHNPFNGVNPKEIDVGNLIDSETRDYLRPASSDEARRSIAAQRREGAFRGVISADADGPRLCYVSRPENCSVREWRLGVAIKMKAERRIFGRQHLDGQWRRLRP